MARPSPRWPMRALTGSVGLRPVRPVLRGPAAHRAIAVDALAGEWQAADRCLGLGLHARLACLVSTPSRYDETPRGGEKIAHFVPRGRRIGVFVAETAGVVEESALDVPEQLPDDRAQVGERDRLLDRGVPPEDGGLARRDVARP